METHSQKFIRRRRFIMVLPLLVIPFLTLIFWALGGGQGTAGRMMEEGRAGLNPELPNAQFGKGIDEWDKLSLYQKAHRDSIKFSEAKRNDPYFKLPPLKGSQDTIKDRDAGSINPSLGKKDPWIDENEARVNRKLSELYKNLNASKEQERTPRYEADSHQYDNTQFSSDVEKLESMMEMMQAGGAQDEEMKEIQSVLDKILDIQHPERVQERLREQSVKNSPGVFSVSGVSDHSVSLIASETGPMDSIGNFAFSTNQFYGVDETVKVRSAPKTFRAEVYNEQTLVSGAIVKLKLTDDIYVNGVLIPKDHFIHGICALNGERLNVTINSIHYGGEIFTVSLSVFDLDGLEGIYVPGAIARDVAKQSSNQAIQDIQMSSLNPSLEIQAASAGIETAKNLLSKKTRLVKASVKAGYKVVLVDNTKLKP